MGEMSPVAAEARGSSQELWASIKGLWAPIRNMFELEKRFSRGRALQARIQAALLRIEHLPEADKAKVLAAEELLRRADKACRLEFEVALRYANEAERILVRESSDAEKLGCLEALANDIRLRWPESQVTPLLAVVDAARKMDAGKPEQMTVLVLEALRLYQDRILRLYAEQERVRDRLILLIWVLFAALAFFLVGLGQLDANGMLFLENGKLTGIWPIKCALVFGTIGACMSAMMSFTYLQRAPDEFETLWITAARPLLGAAAGLVALAVAGTGLINVADTLPKVAAFAFLFGFSERLIIGTVDKFEAREGLAKK